jgi:hypothetical protein
LTVGLVRKLIAPFLVKIGEVLDGIEYSLKTAARAYISHSKAKVTQILGQEPLVAGGIGKVEG